METTKSTYTAFEANRLFCKGPLPEVILRVKRRLGKAENSSVLIFSNATGKTIDFNFQGTEDEIIKRLEIYTTPEASPHCARPGRPKLGVISREISLLPRHWEWLATQPGGASASLRKLVEEAKKKTDNGGAFTVKQVQEKAYSFMSVIAGDFEGYEEALRALYKRDKKKFLSFIQAWPSDIKNYLIEIAKPIF